MKSLIAVLAVLSIFALSSPVTADVGIDTKKTKQPAVNFTWGDGTCSAKSGKANTKEAKGQNINDAVKSKTKKACDYIK